MLNFARALLFLLPIWTTAFDVLTATHAFRTSQALPVRMDPIPREEINQRLGLHGVSSVGSSGPPAKAYSLTNEHEVVCPVSGAHRGVLCTASLSGPSREDDDAEQYGSAESVANDHELVTQAILSGSLAASVRSRCKDGNSVYYLPIVITLVESLMADEMEGFDYYNSGDKEKSTVFNSDGLETNEILMDWTDHDFSSSREEHNGSTGSSVMLYACNTHSDHNSATSDIYVLPKKNDEDAKVWRFSVDYKVATINLGSIPSFGGSRSVDSTTPLRPDVWFKDDYY